MHTLSLLRSLPKSLFKTVYERIFCKKLKKSFHSEKSQVDEICLKRMYASISILKKLCVLQISNSQKGKCKFHTENITSLFCAYRKQCKELEYSIYRCRMHFRGRQKTRHFWMLPHVLSLFSYVCVVFNWGSIMSRTSICPPQQKLGTTQGCTKSRPIFGHPNYNASAVNISGEGTALPS